MVFVKTRSDLYGEPGTPVRAMPGTDTMRSMKARQGNGTATTANVRAGQRDTRRRFLDAALTVFERLGYRDATVKDILQEAGGGRATFYTYFSGKSDVAAQLFEGLLPRAKTYWTELADLADEPELSRASIRKHIDRGLGFWSRNRVIMEALNAAMTHDPATAKRHYQWNIEAIDAFTRRAEESRRAEVQLRATVLVLQWERFCWHWLIQGVPQDRELVLDVFADIWHRELPQLCARADAAAPAPAGEV